MYLLNLITGYKQNDVVIVNPKITRKTQKYIYTYHVLVYSLYTYVHTYTN